MGLEFMISQTFTLSPHLDLNSPHNRSVIGTCLLFFIESGETLYWTLLFLSWGLESKVFRVQPVPRNKTQLEYTQLPHYHTILIYLEWVNQCVSKCRVGEQGSQPKDVSQRKTYLEVRQSPGAITVVMLRIPQALW